MRKRSYDVVIAGGGVMGSSVAYHLSKLAQGSMGVGGKKLSIAVIEKDKKYLTASAMLSGNLNC
jgi:glycine/D-amino acid oxidase-like deaminating enzyme